MAIKYIKAEQGPGSSVIYIDENGKKWIFEKGTRCWRNQNSGNMVVGKVSRRNGMIGKAGGFAVFPDYETSNKTLKDLLLNEYGNFNLIKLMNKYAPPKENKTKKYIEHIKKKTGVSENTLIKNYSSKEFEKLWRAIELMERWEEGTIKEFSSAGQITKVKKNKKGIITSYLVDGLGWLSKREAIQLALENKIQAVVVKRAGSKFLRSHPNTISSDNLESKV
jgi:hypothetical protein